MSQKILKTVLASVFFVTRIMCERKLNFYFGKYLLNFVAVILCDGQERFRHK